MLRDRFLEQMMWWRDKPLYNWTNDQCWYYTS